MAEKRKVLRAETGRGPRIAVRQYLLTVSGAASSDGDQVRTAELLAALSLVTDLARRFPLEHGLHSTLVAMRLCDRLGVDEATARSTYYGCLLFYIGCTADAEVAAEFFDEGALGRYLDPVLFGSRTQAVAGLVHALAGTGALSVQAARVARRLPQAAAAHRQHLRAICEVGPRLGARMGAGRDVATLFTAVTERWDGRGEPGRLRGTQLPLPLRIMHVARDATFQRWFGGQEHAVHVLAQRAGRAFDPAVVAVLTGEAPSVLAGTDEGPAWDAVMAAEPRPHQVLAGDEVDRALAAVGDFADLVSPFLVGHSAGVARLAAEAGRHCGLADGVVRDLRRAGAVHDVGRVAISAGVWQKPRPLSPDEWEQVRLHAYHGERALSRSPFLSTLQTVAFTHHERLDGSGYHRGSTAAALPPPARLLAAADVYQALTEPRPHREALSPARAGEVLRAEAAAERLDASSVTAVLAAAGQPAPRQARPSGLTDRETEVLVLVARGLQTKQVARVLGISPKTADHHLEHAYAKIGVSTRAAAAVFAMEHGLLHRA